MIVLTITGASCGHCKATIERAAHAVDPAAAVTVDLAAQTVAIDSAAAAERFKQAVAAAGFPVVAVA